MNTTIRVGRTVDEIYRIALTAFYALCIQKALDTCISYFNQNPMSLESGYLLPHVSPGHQVAILQTTGFVLWVSLYFIENLTHYYELDDGPSRNRITAHALLSVALVFFYLFAATLGSPSRGQLGYILAILALDTIYPFLIRKQIGARATKLWVVRGLVQFAAILGLYRFAPEEIFRTTLIALVFAGIMLIQLVALAPLEAHLRGVARLRTGSP